MDLINNISIFKGNFFDIFSLAHLISGIWISIFLELYVTKDNKKIFLWGSLIHLIYEIKDFSLNYKLIKPPDIIQRWITILWGRPDYKNGFKNSIGDQISYSLGYLIYKFLKEKCKIKFTTKSFWIFFILSMILFYIFLNIEF
tara:strand:- start:45 stop:473 length:429 start_codon:yes stop_codon:yes gene_type:complete